MSMQVAERMPSKVAVFRQELENMTGQFEAALPAHIPVERFARVIMTAIQTNPELLECERRSLWNACIKAATDGLLPDGREGAMVVRKDSKRGKIANWQPMVAGLRKKVRNSGEITTWDAHCVYDGDTFQFQLGDDPKIHHSYDLKTPRGNIIGAYSVAVMKDGQKSYEVMSIAEIHAIRDKSDAWKAHKAGFIKSTPWADYEGEMCRKTVARRHAKVLPMSTDLDDIMRRDDGLYQFEEAKEEAKRKGHSTLASKLDALAHIAPSDGRDDEHHDPETGEIKGEGTSDADVDRIIGSDNSGARCAEASMAVSSPRVISAGARTGSATLPTGASSSHDHGPIPYELKRQTDR